MRAATLRLWQALSGQHAKPLPPPHVVRAQAERSARILQEWLPFWGFGLVLVVGTQWGLVHWVNAASDWRFTLELLTQVALVLVAVGLTRGPEQPPERVVRVAIGMMLAMVGSGALYRALFPGVADGFSMVVVCYLLSARLMLSAGVTPQLVISAACVVAHVAVLVVIGLPLPVIVGNAVVFMLVSALLMIGVVVTEDDQLDRLYRQQMNRVAFAMASLPAAQAQDVRSAVRQIIELTAATLEVTRVEVWLLDDERTVMRWFEGYDCATGAHPVREDIPLRDHRGYVSGLDQEPLVESYELPSAVASARICPHVGGACVTSVLEAAARVGGRTGGVLCFQQEGRRRSWTSDERRFASYMAHLVALAIEASERHRAETVLRRTVAELEQRSSELSRTVATLNEHIVERRNVERELRDSRTQLRALSTRLLQVQEEERRRMAREIHDELGQTLTALRLDVAWLGRRLDGAVPAVGQKLERMGAMVDATVESVQAIARNLRPPLLDDVGLAAALEWQAREFEARTAISCRLTLNRDDIELDADRSIAVFRLVQEALTNVARHAQATRVTIALHEVRGRLLIRVRDNGRGIRRDEMAHGGALGLLGMRERVHLWGGRLRIDGRAGKGTLLRAEIPLLESAPLAKEGSA